MAPMTPSAQFACEATRSYKVLRSHPSPLQTISSTSYSTKYGPPFLHPAWLEDWTVHRRPLSLLCYQSPGEQNYLPPPPRFPYRCIHCLSPLTLRSLTLPYDLPQSNPFINSKIKYNKKTGAFSYHSFIPLLTAQGYGIVLPELKGYGKTDKPTNVQALAYKTQSDEIVKLLDAEEIKKVIVVGHDFG